MNGDLILTLLVVLGLWVCTWYIWPYDKCRTCNGSSRLYSPMNDGTFRTCPRCSGTGKRMRTERQIIGIFSRKDRR